MKKFTSIISAIAAIAIAWYLCTYYSAFGNWWILPVIAISIGMAAAILPELTNRLKIFWSPISTGITLLVFQTVVETCSLTTNAKMWFLAILIFVIAIITEILAHGFGVLHVSEIIFDLISAIIFAKLIIWLSAPMTTVIFLTICFVFAILIDFKAGFCLKQNTRETESNVENDDNYIIE